ncbi:MAG: CopG family transcriptional regulator [Thermodesulfobacterium sp.]|nr:CopG family transcriptional regulator [Thermodesulfobacterium sp.]
MNEKPHYRTTLYLDYELIKKLKEIARSKNTSLTKLINQAIEEYIKNEQQQEQQQQTKEKK